MKLEHIIDNNQSLAELELIWKTTKKIENLYYFEERGRKWLKEILKGKRIICLFNQPSTRTRLKFSFAGKVLGADVDVIDQISSTSIEKGEDWYNTLRTFSEKEINILTIRHPQNYIPRYLATLCKKYKFRVKIINGGDGNHLHPTQAIGDLYTIKEHFKERFGKDPLKIAIGADPKNARTLHSLVILLAKFPVQLTIISWPELRMPRKYLQGFINQNKKIREIGGFPQGEKFDVIYWVRYQIEYEQKRNYQKEYNQKFKITPELLDTFLEKDGIFLHPGPRTEEVDTRIDSDPRVKDGEQMRNGDFTTMALYTLMLNPVRIPKPSEL